MRKYLAIVLGLVLFAFTVGGEIDCEVDGDDDCEFICA